MDGGKSLSRRDLAHWDPVCFWGRSGQCLLPLRKAPRADPSGDRMTDNADLETLVAKALKELSTAMKAIAFYPSHHPSVVSTLDRVAATFREALAATESLRIGIAEVAFLVGNRPVAGEDRMLAGFATYLSRRGIGVLVLRPPLEVEALKGLLEVLALDPATLQARGGPACCLAERRVGGVTLEEFDPGAALRSARTGPSETTPQGAAEKRPAAAWNDILARFLVGQEPAPPPGGTHLLRRLAGDGQAARALVVSLRTLADAAGPSGGTLISTALGKVAGEVAAAEPEALPSLAANLAAALFDLSPTQRMQVLQGPLPVPGTDSDLARDIRVRIPADRVGEMVVSLVQSQGKLNARLTSVVRKVLTDAGGIETHREAVLKAVQGAKRPGADPLEDIWKSIEDLLEESEDQWISREYKGLLELLGAESPALDESMKRTLAALPGFVESLTVEGLRLRAWVLFGDLLEIDTEPARLWVALDQIARRAESIGPGWYAASADVAAAARAVLEAAPPSQPHVREAGENAVQAIARHAIRSYRKEFHNMTPAQREILTKLFEALGPHAVEPLVAGLQQEEDWEIRKTFLAFLVARGREAVPVLVRRLTDTSWYLVRNALLILGDIGDSSTVPAIAATLKHPEARVRRDAVTALGKIGGPRAFALVQECLGDPEMAEVAMRCLASIDRPRTVAAYLKATDGVDVWGRREARLREAITVLGILGAPESIPRLQTILLRGLWLPPWAGDGVRIAAARALERIGTAAALRAVARGTRLWRGPVRAACTEILQGRPTTLDLD